MRRVHVIALAIALLTALALTGSATAHETREIGKYRLVVGWLNEPALVSEPNSVDFRVTRADSNEPVEGLEKTVKVTVIYGTHSKEFALRPRFRTPGAYNAELIPTQAGDYVFHFSGSIEGMPINAHFDTADRKFNAVQSLDELQFPVAEPSALQLQRDAREARADAGAAMQRGTLLGGLGLAAGLVGVAAGLFALRRVSTS
ncbi:MAG: hypothetical protein HYY04_13945 [Chloroflexi bacterium]|nr:hypothetical protein [Chloroflexota bacterium]